MKQNKVILFFTKNWISKILSLVFAVLIFVFIQFSFLEKRTIKIPLTIIYPDSYSVESIVPENIQVTISGSENIIYLIPVSSIEAQVDFSEVDKNGVAKVPVELSFNVPKGELLDLTTLSLSSDPGDIRLYFEESL